MKIIQSKKYKEIIKKSEYGSDMWQVKLENVKEQVHNGVDIYETIGREFPGFSTDQTEQVKDYVFQALGKSVPTSDPAAYQVGMI